MRCSTWVTCALSRILNNQCLFTFGYSLLPLSFTSLVLSDIQSEQKQIYLIVIHGSAASGIVLCRMDASDGHAATVLFRGWLTIGE